jgi:serine phosphatase RsbU (regulator of sigma subunit)
MPLGDDIVTGAAPAPPQPAQTPGGRTVLATHATFAEALLEQSQGVRSYVVVMHDYEPEGRHLVGIEPLTVGRDPARHIVVADDQVSRLHLQIAAVGNDLFVEDLGSSNGTFANDGRRITAPLVLPPGAAVRVGSHLLVHERCTARDAELARELEKASTYVRALLPAQIPAGPIRIDWFFRPSLRLGGDAFGYFPIDDDNVAFYLIDVSGHGVSAAMHSVSVANILRPKALSVDLRDPAAVLGSLNEAFPMDAHDGMYFTIWYGVYSASRRELTYSSAGHHPSQLCAGGPTRVALGGPSPMIGAIAGYCYQAQLCRVPAAAVLYLFSDGAFETTTREGHQHRLEDFLPLLGAAGAGQPGEAERIYRAVRGRARPGPLEDDFSLLAVSID